MPSLLKVILVALLLSYLGLGLIALLFANALIFPAPRASYGSETGLLRIPLDGRSEYFVARHLRNPDADKVIFYHGGNGEDLGTTAPRIQGLHDRGYSVFAWDYPGYGLSPGRPSQAAVLAGAEAGWHYLVEELGYRPDQIILYGRSLGGGPAVYLASTRKARGMILESTFTSTFRVLTRIRILPWDVFDNLAAIPRVQCPVLFVHGTRDFVVPFRHGPKLWKIAPEPKAHLWIDGGGHNNLVEEFGDTYWPTVTRFLENL